jgi:hypothetical protein
MNRVLTFASKDTQRFEDTYMGFLAGGNYLHRHGEERSREERSKEAKIIRALKSISNPEGPELRVLIPAGGSAVFEQQSFLLLEKYLAAAPWPTQDSDRVDELLDWVSMACSRETP